MYQPRVTPSTEPQGGERATEVMHLFGDETAGGEMPAVYAHVKLACRGSGLAAMISVREEREGRLVCGRGMLGPNKQS